MKALERLEIRTLSTKGKETLRHRFSNTLRKNFLTSRFKQRVFRRKMLPEIASVIGLFSEY